MKPTSRLLLAGLVAWATGCADPDPDSTFLARAAGFQLTVSEATDLLSQVDTVETPRRAALALSELWVDYTLLATAVAEDSTLSQLEIDPVIDQQSEQIMAAALRDSVARADGTVSDAEISRLYAAEGEDSELRVRQIRIDVPPDAPAAEHDSAREALEGFRRRIVEGGEDFAELAREHSQDPMSRQEGGDLGFFGPGDMVPPFDSAARSLEVGEVSEPVQTVYGWHLIRLEGRRTPTREQFAGRVRRQRSMEAIGAYMAALEEAAQPRIRPAAANVFRQLAADPEAELPAATPETLVSFQGGQLTVADIRSHMRLQPEPLRRQMAGADAEEVMNRGLLPLVRQKMVVAEAHRQGIELPYGERAAAVDTLRQRVRATARQLGLLPITNLQELGRTAIEQAVDGLITEIVVGGRPITRLGMISTVLRRQYPYQVRDDRTLLVERQLEAMQEAEEVQEPQETGGQ